MGAVTFSIDPGLVDHLQRSLPMKVFVETGTHHGDTLELVKDKFGELHSVELSPNHYEMAAARFSGLQHVNITLGHSAKALAAWSPRLRTSSVLYFLDAHWCETAENTAGADAQCPLLEEINAIGHLNEKSVLVIDDARLFLAPPPAPHAVVQWPTLPELIEAMRHLAPAHRLMVLNDTFVLYPPALHEAMQRYARSAGIDLLTLMSKQCDYDNLREQFNGLQRQLQEKELALTVQCEALEADAGLTAIQDLQDHLQRAEKACADRLALIEALQKELDARLEVIRDLQDHWQRAEATCAARLNVIEQLESRCQQLEASLASTAGNTSSGAGSDKRFP